MSDLAHEADVKISIYFRKPTDKMKGYISAYTTYPKREGEDWNRGNDLSDGDWKQRTVERIKRDIDRIFDQQKVSELVKKRTCFRMTKLFVINFFFVQWLFFRITMSGDNVDGKFIQTHWGFLFPVFPLTGWWSDYIPGKPKSIKVCRCMINK